MKKTATVTQQIREQIMAYLKDVEATNESLKNITPGTYAKVKARLVQEFVTQEQRMALPPEVIHIDEIKAVIATIRGENGAAGYGRKPQ